MMNIKYSLIIPHFSDPARLERLLQTVPVERQDVEVLVVDDCSPNQSELDILKEKWPMVHWLSTPENKGAGAARNVGLANATGERLVFADSDDEFLSGAFDIFDQNVNKDDELVFFLAEAVQEVNGSPSSRADWMNSLCNNFVDSPTGNNHTLLKTRHVVPWAKVYSRCFIDGIKIKFEETRVSNDVSFNVLAAVQAKHVRVVPTVVYRIFRRANSLTSKDNPKRFLERVRTYARLSSSLKTLGVQHRLPATGWMLASLAYGPITAFKACLICLGSDLQIDFTRALQLSRWIDFIKIRIAVKAEKNRIEH